MPERVLVVSPHPQLTAMAAAVAADSHGTVEVAEACLQRAVDCARRVAGQGRCAIVTTPYHSSLIREAVRTTPVVVIGVTPYELVRAVYKARRFGSRIAFLGYGDEKLALDFKELREMLGLELEIFHFRDGDDIKTQVRRMRERAFDAVVTTGVCAVQAARAVGLHGTLVHIDREAIEDAIGQARSILAAHARDLERDQQLETVLNSSRDGIIVIDRHGTVTLVNAVAESLLGVRSRELVGRSAGAVTAGHETLARVFQDGDSDGHRRLHVGGRELAVARKPIRVGQRSVGSILTVHDVTAAAPAEHAPSRKPSHQGLVAKYELDDVIGHSAGLRQAVQAAREFARVDTTLLLAGESGTGKELFAQGIHNASARRHGPFVAVNCATLPADLLESELFGYDDGAFTGARKGGKRGLFEQASGGTLLLDEIGEIPVSLQAQLLRVLQEKEIRRVGGSRVIPVDVRIIAATNRDLRRDSQESRFRSDLFFRLNVLNVRIPPLRERIDDIPILADYFIHKYCALFHRIHVRLSPDMLEVLAAYHWPGNVRELECVLERYVLLCRESEGDAQLFYRTACEAGIISTDDTAPAPRPVDGYISVQLGTMDEMKRQIIRHLVSTARGNKQEVARLLGVSRTTLWKNLKQFD